MALFTFAFISPAEFSKQVKQKVTGTSLLVQNLEEEVTYTFTVRAQTIDYGPATIGNVTTGPQDGSPVALRDLLLAKTVSSVEMHWKNGPSGKGPILGYYIESKKRGKRMIFVQIGLIQWSLEENGTEILIENVCFFN